MTSLFNDPLFRKIYRKWSSRKRRHPESNIDVLQEAKKEYEWRKEKQTLEQDKPYKPYTTPKPSPDYYVNVLGTTMLNSQYRKLIQTQQQKGTAPTPTPDEDLKQYLISLFQNDKPKTDKTIPIPKQWKTPYEEEEEQE